MGFDNLRSSRRQQPLLEDQIKDEKQSLASAREQRARDRALGITRADRIKLQELESSKSSSTQPPPPRGRKRKSFFSCLCGETFDDQEDSPLVTCVECQMEQHAICVYESRGITDVSLDEWTLQEFSCDVCLEVMQQEHLTIIFLHMQPKSV